MYLFVNFKKYSRLISSNKNQFVNICEIHLCYSNLKFVYAQILIEVTKLSNIYTEKCLKYTNRNLFPKKIFMKYSNITLYKHYVKEQLLI